MPKYKVLAKCCINNRLYEEGEVVDYEGSIVNSSGKKAKHLELIEEAPAKVQKSKQQKEDKEEKPSES